LSHQKPIPKKDEIEALYFKEGGTISSLSRHYKTSNPTVRKWLDFYGIKKKSQQQASSEANNRHKFMSMPNKLELAEMYSGNSIKALEKYYSVSQKTIYEWLENYDIELKDLSEACRDGKNKQFEHMQFDKEFLEKKYDRKKPLTILADDLGVSYSYLKKLFKKYDMQVEVPWRSKAEIELFEYCERTYGEYDWIHNTKEIITPFELDIYNKKNSLAIEYCGNVWHSENFGKKKSNYHQKKFIMCEEVGVKLITIFESDDTEKVKKLLNTIHGKNKRVYARKTEVKRITVEESRKFHNEHHMHGFIPARYHYGLFNQGELVMACSFGKSRYNKKYEYECARMSSHSDFTVVGGASKLFSNFIKIENPNSIITYADLRFGDGKVYEHCGFSFSGLTPPNYWYFNKRNPRTLFSRVAFQKHKLKTKLEYFDEAKTEYENMLENGWDRIWDCGSAIYTWTKKEGQ